MKKILILIAVLVIGWLGATFYIGNNIESESQKLISNMQEKYKNMGMELKVDFKEKSFFNSKAEMTFDYTSPELKKMVSLFYKLPHTIVYKVEHGPHFFKDGFGTGISRIRSEKSIVSFLNDDLKNDFGLSDKDFVLNTDSVISFNKNMSTKASMAPVKFNNPDSDIGIETALFQGQSDVNLDTLASTGNFSLPFIKVFNPDDPSKDFYHAEGITIDFDIEKFIADGLYIGDISIKTKEMTLSSIDFEGELKFKADLDIKIDEDQDKNIKLVYAVNAEHIKGDIPEEFIPFKINPKKAAINLTVEGLTAKGLIAFQKYSQEVSSKSQKLIEKVMSAEGEDRNATLAELGNFQREMQSKMIDLAQDLFAPKKGKISYNVKFENDQKKMSHANVNLAYIGDKFTGSMVEIIEKFKENPFDLFKLNVDLSVDDSLMQALRKEMSETEKEKTDAGLKTGIAQGIIVKGEDGSYKAKVDYEPNKLILNGKEMPEMIDMLKMLSQH
jgi:uncharacterized protein YdgA (DUF945 family)